MFEFLSKNRNCRVLCFLCFVLSIGFLQAQEQKTIPEIEKIYLHTDKSIYFIGEDLWYKAYDVRASNNLLFDNSNILYVELISPDSEIIARNKTNIEIGLGHGDFQLTDSLGVKPGVYQLRAYTNWNRNFGEDFVFKKNIEIIDAFKSYSKTDEAQNTATEKLIAPMGNPNNFRIDFFPEGGSLIENVASIVGFKGVNSNGNPINVTGEIYNSDDELVTPFSSPHDGMGKFQMIPIEGKNYYAKIKTPDGKLIRIELPKVAKEGYLLGYRTVKGKNIISISTNEKTLLQNPNAALTVVCKARGVSYFENTQTLTQTTFSFELSKDSTPEGISQITLYDSNSKPQSERLIYIEKDQDLDVQLLTDKVIYKPYEKATVNVVSKSKTGVAKSASFSVSVTDMNRADEKNSGTTICSYFLLESDIRGKVFNPGYYFDPSNLKRLEHLDDLLLTQGWRDFLWKSTSKFSDLTTYKAEKGITISGRVKQLFGNKAKVNNRVGLVLLNKNHMNSFKTFTDVSGSFKFENLMFSGKTKMVLNSKNENGKYGGELIANPEQSPMPVSAIKEPFIWDESTRLLVYNVFRKFTAFGVKPENMLDEIQIKGQKKKYAVVSYGAPDYKYIIDKEEAKKLSNSADLIEEQCKGVIPNNFSMELNSYFDESPENSKPIILIDGYQVNEAGELLGIAPEDILKIEVVSGYVVDALYGRGSVISVFTNGNRNKAVSENSYSVKQEIDGFYTERVFYSPTPEQAELDNKLAVRNTIYWNPFVHPDATGNAILSFFNTKVETKVKVELEGITATGIPVTKKVYYTIKK